MQSQLRFTIFCLFLQLRGPHSRSYTRWFAPCFWRSYYQPQSWSRLATAELLDYYLCGAVKDKCYADKPKLIAALKDNIREAINGIQSMAIVVGPCLRNFCLQKLKRRILTTFDFNRAALRVTQPKLHSMFCSLFLKIALSAAELMSFGYFGTAIWHRWTIICKVPPKISVTPTSQS